MMPFLISRFLFFPYVYAETALASTSEDSAIPTALYGSDDMTKGYYVVVAFEADNACVKELDRLMGINQSIVRFMITRDEASAEAK